MPEPFRATFPDEDYTAFELEPGQVVGCHICMQSVSTHARQFKRGEAYLVGPGVFGGNAHYICKAHLPDDMPIEDVYKEHPLRVIKIWFDGGSGATGYGSYEIDGGHGLQKKVSRQDFGRKTNNEAEYLALIHALRWLSTETTHGADRCRVEIWTDSMLVRCHVKGSWKCRKPHLVPLRDEVRALLRPYAEWEIKWHRRHNNVSRFGH